MKRRKPYAEEFKQEAVRLVTEQGMGVTQVARDLDVSLDTCKVCAVYLGRLVRQPVRV